MTHSANSLSSGLPSKAPHSFRVWGLLLCLVYGGDVRIPVDFELRDRMCLPLSVLVNEADFDEVVAGVEGVFFLSNHRLSNWNSGLPLLLGLCSSYTGAEDLALLFALDPGAQALVSYDVDCSSPV